MYLNLPDISQSDIQHLVFLVIEFRKQKTMCKFRLNRSTGLRLMPLVNMVVNCGTILAGGIGFGLLGAALGRLS